MTTEQQKLRELFKKRMPHVVAEHIDGVVYQKWGAPEMPSVQAGYMRQMVCRPEDVFSIGWPRSGNNWTFFVLDMILRQDPVPSSSSSFVESAPDLWSHEQRAIVDATTSPRLFCTHSLPSRLPDLARKKSRLVYIVRSPKDAMISYYKLMLRFGKEFQFVGTWDEFFDLCMGGEYTWGTWFDHILDVEKYMDDNPDVPVYIHHFEEMKEKPVECIKRICAFLGVPDEKAEEIAVASGIESIKNAANNQSAVNNLYFEPGKSEFIQKGEIGNWKKVFSVAQNERFNRVFEERMGASKLAQLIKKYI